MKHQNILFITMDQFRADLLHGNQHRSQHGDQNSDLANFVDLPNIRALMGDAVSFTNHWSVITPCGPSRASLLTGQYAMNHRSVRNGAPLDHTIPTLPGEMSKAGYTPLLFGYTDTAQDPRIHHPDDPALQSYEMPMAGFHEMLEMRHKLSMPWRDHLARQGYDLPPYSQFYIPDGPDLDSPAFYAKEDSDTAFLTDQFLSFLADSTVPAQDTVNASVKASAKAPWLAHLTYIRPHPPLVAPAPYNRLYQNQNIPVPLPLPNDFLDHPIIREARSRVPFASFVSGFPDLAQTPEATQTLRQVYLGLVNELDQHIGRIIDALKASGQYDQTLIILTSDHGEMLGDFGIWGKSTVFDAAFRVPLIIRDPNLPTQGQTIGAPTETIDIFPTLLEFSGQKPPGSVDGCSLIPLLHGQTPDTWRDYTWSELDFARIPAAPGDALPVSKCNLSILREADLTLVHFNANLPPFLFDHRTTGETKSVANDPAYANEMLRLTRRMLDHRMTHANQTLSNHAITAHGVVQA